MAAAGAKVQNWRAVNTCASVPASARQPRHLKGCYLSRDSVYSAVGLLRRQPAQEAQA